MSEFPECLLIVIAEVDAAIEGEWNRWYDTVHLPDALRCPGVRRGRRYVSSGEISETAAGKTERTARRIYTTIYELDSPDAVATPEFRAMRGWYQFAPHVRSRTQVIVPVPGRAVSWRCQLILAAYDAGPVKWDASAGLVRQFDLGCAGSIRSPEIALQRPGEDLD